jgi:hypothetical protein
MPKKTEKVEQDLNVVGFERQNLHNSALVIVYREEFPK